MFKVLIVDDEESARETVHMLIKKTTLPISVIGKVDSVDAALELISKDEPQIIFLDINMPEKNGLELFENISAKNFQIIFTTAYEEYAIKAINLSACYYLLKPISPIEFTKALNKAIENITTGVSYLKNIDFLMELVKKPESFPEKIIAPTKKGYELINVDSILFFEGDKNYSWINTESSKYLVAKTLKEYEGTIDPAKFFRVHQSFIVNKLYVKAVLNTKPDSIELTNGMIIAVSRDKKKEFIDWLAK
ncbi:MAG: LytTR family DNA-binding domain-containing protein [Bacteroidia bacterium]